MLASDLQRNICQAWLRLRNQILSDPHELHRRLARRRMKCLTRPPRPWCIAIRASDRRITPAHWIIVPEHAMDLDHPAHPYEPIEHEVIIRPHALRKFCRPVRTDAWARKSKMSAPSSASRPAICSKRVGLAGSPSDLSRAWAASTAGIRFR